MQCCGGETSVRLQVRNRLQVSRSSIGRIRIRIERGGAGRFPFGDPAGEQGVELAFALGQRVQLLPVAGVIADQIGADGRQLGSPACSHPPPVSPRAAPAGAARVRAACRRRASRWRPTAALAGRLRRLGLRRRRDGRRLRAQPLPPVAVVADVRFDVRPLDDQEARADAIEEVAVMADGDQGSFVGAERVFQRFARRDVEVVGRLVEHQHVAREEHDLRHRQPAALAA